MNKEIERKYTVNPRLQLCDIFELVRGCKNDDIKDYYFNPMTRLRFKNDKAYITIKSMPSNEVINTTNGFEAPVRDEFEFEINKKQLNFIPTPMLCKTRYYYDFKGYTFEINIYPQIKDKNDRNLILVEVELDKSDEVIDLPQWIDHDVSYHPSFYNYAIYAMLLANNS